MRMGGVVIVARMGERLEAAVTPGPTAFGDLHPGAFLALAEDGACFLGFPLSFQASASIVLRRIATTLTVPALWLGVEWKCVVEHDTRHITNLFPVPAAFGGLHPNRPSTGWSLGTVESGGEKALPKSHLGWAGSATSGTLSETAPR